MTPLRDTASCTDSESALGGEVIQDEHKADMRYWHLPGTIRLSIEQPSGNQMDIAASQSLLSVSVEPADRKAVR